MASVWFGFLAGILSILSPCVLPLLPIIVGAALSEHRFGPLALAAGLAVSFVTIGLFVATIGFAVGLDNGVFRLIAGILMLLLGAALLLPNLQTRLATAAGPAVGWAENRVAGLSAAGPAGQFGLGLLLGAVWIPCVGPTLGAASLMAARGENLGQVVLVMVAFGIGAALPLLLIGRLSRAALMRWRDRLMASGRGGRLALGILLVLFGGLIVTGLDRPLETFLVEVSPDWLNALTTRF